MTNMVASKNPSRRASGDEETFGCGNGELKLLLLNVEIVKQTATAKVFKPQPGFSNSVAAWYHAESKREFDTLALACKKRERQHDRGSQATGWVSTG